MRPKFPFLREALNFSFEALRGNKVRTALTALGLLIGNADGSGAGPRADRPAAGPK